jgi:hypothetical protein
MAGKGQGMRRAALVALVAIGLGGGGGTACAGVSVIDAGTLEPGAISGAPSRSAPAAGTAGAFAEPIAAADLAGNQGYFLPVHYPEPGKAPVDRSSGLPMSEWAAAAAVVQARPAIVTPPPQPLAAPAGWVTLLAGSALLGALYQRRPPLFR